MRKGRSFERAYAFEQKLRNLRCCFVDLVRLECLSSILIWCKNANDWHSNLYLGVCRINTFRSFPIWCSHDDIFICHYPSMDFYCACNSTCGQLFWFSALSRHWYHYSHWADSRCIFHRSVHLGHQIPESQVSVQYVCCSSHCIHSHSDHCSIHGTNAMKGQKRQNVRS